MAFRIFFNVRFYYPVFMILFLDFGITLEQFGILNAAWAAAIVLLEVPSGALADLFGRKRLLIAAACLMVAEMLLLCLVPVPSPWVFPALLLNRIVSGAAEAFASGADEALAYDSMQEAQMAEEWPKVLERLMQIGACVAMAAMVTGSLLYDPRPLNAFSSSFGLSWQLTATETFRLPVWLTLGSAIGAVIVTLSMSESSRFNSHSKAELISPFHQTISTGAWILGHPLVLVVIVAGVLCDLPIRQLLVVSSEIYRQIQIPEPAFGLVGAGSAALSLIAAGPIRRLAMKTSAFRNVVILFCVTLIGLIGTSWFLPWWGVIFAMLLSLTMRMVMFLQSHYLNQLVDSKHRATVLSFRGLAVNVSYGAMSLIFAATIAGFEATSAPSHSGTLVEADHQIAAFRSAVTLLPYFFIVTCALFFLWMRRKVADNRPFFRQGGFVGDADLHLQ